MINQSQLVDRLVGVINDPDRPRPLKCIGHIRYPPKGVYVRDIDDSTVDISVAIWGHEYKCRQKPKFPPVVDRLRILDCLNIELLPDYLVVGIWTDNSNITLRVKEKANGSKD